MAQAPDTKQTISRIFVASPGDLAEERRRFPKILEKLNQIKANALGVHLEPLGWEDTLPGMGRPQALINKDVERCDLFVMLLWKRWGTPPAEKSRYSSGTEEEYELARRLHKETPGKPEVFLYFREVPEEMLADPGEQLQKVLAFRKKIEEERALLYARYAKPKEWEELLMNQIARWLDGLQPLPTVPSAPLPPDALERIGDLEKQLRQVSKQHQDAQTKLRQAASEFASRAVAAAKNGRLTEAEEFFARANQMYPEPWVINATGLYYEQIGALQRAEEKFQQLEQAGHSENNREYLAVAYGNLGVIYQTRGELDKAEEMHRKSLALGEELGRKQGMASAYGNLGLIYGTRGELDKAEEMLRKALALNQELGRKQGMASAYGNLGVIYKIRGELDKAEEMHRKSLALEEELGRKQGMASDYGNLGIIYKIRGELDKAEQMHRKALALDQELGRKEGMASAYGNLGLIYQTRGELDKAEEMHRKSLALEQELGRKEGMASDYGNLGVIYGTRGELDRGEEMLRKALTLNQELGRKEGMANQYCNLGLIHQTRGELDKAEEMLRNALTLFEEVGAQPKAEHIQKLLNKLR